MQRIGSSDDERSGTRTNIVQEMEECYTENQHSVSGGRYQFSADRKCHNVNILNSLLVIGFFFFFDFSFFFFVN
jgi:hypothetical protein